MQTQLVGVLRTPLGNPLPNQRIRITALTTDGTVEHSTSSYYSDANGNYELFLLEGKYTVEVLVQNEYTLSGEIWADQSMPSGITLEEAIQYSSTEPVDTQLDTSWKQLWVTLTEHSLTRTRENSVEIGDANTQITDSYKTHVSDTGSERGAEHTEYLDSCAAVIQREQQVFSNAADAFTAEQVVRETPNASLVQKDEISSRIKRSEASTTEHSDISSNLVQDASISHSESMTAATGTITSNVVKTAAQIALERFSTTGTKSLRKKDTVSNTEVKSELILVGDQTTSVKLSTDASGSKHEVITDLHTIGNGGIPNFSVDTKTGVIKINGRLQVSNYEDENGNPIEKPKDGDTIRQVFQYSDSLNGPWSDTLESHHYFKRENIEVNGVVDPGGWGVPYQFRADKGDKGDTGKSQYEEHQYSNDGVTGWTDAMKDGDKYRRSRVVTDGVAGPWSEPHRIVGSDGDNYQTRSQYSIDGIYFWHDTLAPEDKYERRAVFKNGEQEEPWSDPFPIGKGDPGDSAPNVRLSATANVFKWDRDNNPIAPNEIVFTADVVSVTEDLVWTTVPNDLGLTGSDNTRTLTRDAFGDNETVTVQVSAHGIQDKISIFRVKDGTDSIVGFLTNETHTVQTSYSGTGGDYSDAGGEFVVYDGVTVVPTDQVTYSVVTYSNVSIGIDSAGVYTVTGLSADQGVAKLRAEYKGVVIDKLYTISKSKQGNSGWNGVDGDPGSGWYTIVNGTGDWPGDSSATSQFLSHTGRYPERDDHLTFVDKSPDSTNSTTKRYEYGQWKTPVMAIDGDMIVLGTLSGNRIVGDSITGNEISSATTIIAGSGSWTAGMNGDHSSGSAYKDYTHWSGAANPAIAPFRVATGGGLYAEGATVKGHIEADSGYFNGNLGANSVTTGAIIGGAVSVMRSNQGGAGDLNPGDAEYVCSLTLDGFAGYNGNLYITISYRGSSVGLATNIGVQLYENRGSGFVLAHEDFVSIPREYTTSGATCFASVIPNNTVYHLYLKNNWTDGMARGGYAYIQGMVTLR